VGAETAIRSLLAAAGGVTSLVGDRIAHGTRGRGEALPAVTFSQITGSNVEELAGATDFVWATYQVNCWGAKAIEAAELAAAVKTALRIVNQTVEGLAVDHIRILDEGDVPVLAADNELLELKGKRLDIRIAFTE
jgi:hypothetical protein